jgi:poly(3-hydroxybutyrate) depolymerase
MTHRSRLLAAALMCLPAAPALLSATRVQAMPFTPTATPLPRTASVLDVANRRQPGEARSSGDAQVEQLNQMSLQRAQEGQNSPGAGPDTTARLNNTSDQDAARGQNLGGKPMQPFR